MSFFHTYFSKFHKTKTRTYIKNLRHGSLHLSVIYENLKFDVSKYIIKRDILIQKIYLKKSFFTFLTLKLNNAFIYNFMIYNYCEIDFSFGYSMIYMGVYTLSYTIDIIFRRERGEMTLHHSSLSLKHV